MRAARFRTCSRMLSNSWCRCSLRNSWGQKAGTRWVRARRLNLPLRGSWRQGRVAARSWTAGRAEFREVKERRLVPREGKDSTWPAQWDGFQDTNLILTLMIQRTLS